MKKETNKTVSNELMKEIIIPVKNLIETKNVDVMINCVYKGDDHTVESQLTDEIGNEYKNR